MRQPNSPVFSNKPSGPSELQTQQFTGVLRATVEYNNDPLQQGRIKARLWQIHGPQGTDIKTKVPTENLPWALPCFPLAGGQDFGSFIVPPVGSTVWLMFAGGDADQPVYMGGWYAINNEPDKYLRSQEKPAHEISMAPGTQPWTGNRGPEAPSEAMEMLHASPEVYVPIKSPKGAAVVISDKDERELTAFIDRGGQGLFLETEITKGSNVNNAKARGSQSAYRTRSPISISEDTVASETRVLLIDAAGQSVILHAHKGSERLRLVSRVVEDDNSNFSGAKEEIAIELDAGSKRVTINASQGADAGAKVIVDVAAGTVEIQGPLNITLEAQTMFLTGRLIIRGDTILSGNQTINGDLTVTGKLIGGEAQ